MIAATQIWRGARQLLLALLIALLATDIAAGEPDSKKADCPDPSDRVCGPRCVQFVLRWFGKDEPLVTLVREMQSPAIGDGATLDALQAALERRGIRTHAVEFPARTAVNWDEPVIVVAKQPGQEMAHYAVWLPSSTDSRVDLWWGLRGVRSFSASDFEPRQFPVVLLTSSTPIQNPQRAFLRRSSRPEQLGASIGAGLFLSLVMHSLPTFLFVRRSSRVAKTSSYS